MRLLICTNEDIIGALLLNQLLPALARHEVSVTLTQNSWLPKGEAPGFLQELYHIEQTVPVGQWFRLFDREGVEGAYATFEGLRRRHALPLSRHAAIRNDAALADFRAFAPDLIISLRYGGIFQPEHIAIAKHGVWNVHSGRLPLFRGVMATFRAMLQGEAAGITLHRVPDATIDTGVALAERALPLQPGRSMLWHIAALYPLAVEMIVEMLAKLEAGEALPELRPQGRADRYYSYPTAEEVAAFHAQGWRFFHAEDVAGWWEMFAAGG